MNLDAIRRRTSQLTPHLQRAVGEAVAQVNSGMDRAVAQVNIGMDRAAAHVSSGVDRARSAVAQVQATNSTAPAAARTPSQKFPSLPSSSDEVADLPEALDVRVCSWNLHGSPLDPADDIDQWVAPRGPAAGLYVIGVQELVDLNPRSFVMNTAGNDQRQLALEAKVEEALRKKGREFTKVCSFGMVGLALLCYVDTSLVPLVSEVDCDRVKTAFEGVGGNKGAVCVRLSLGPLSLCFVNLHLPSGQHAGAERDQHMHTILSDAFQSVSSSRGSARPSKYEFQRRSAYQAERHDFVAIFGDFNFRLNFADGRQPPGPPELWLEKDERMRGQAARLRSFEEGPIVFPPTFKYIPGTDSFNQNRCPAWCDRVLYKSTPGIGVQLMEYDSVGELRHTSDHRPVVAGFRIPTQSVPASSSHPVAHNGAQCSPTPKEQSVETSKAQSAARDQVASPARFQPPAREPQIPEQSQEKEKSATVVPPSDPAVSSTPLGVDESRVTVVTDRQRTGEGEEPRQASEITAKPPPPLETFPVSSPLKTLPKSDRHDLASTTGEEGGPPGKENPEQPDVHKESVSAPVPDVDGHSGDASPSSSDKLREEETHVLAGQPQPQPPPQQEPTKAHDEQQLLDEPPAADPDPAQDGVRELEPDHVSDLSVTGTSLHALPSDGAAPPSELPAANTDDCHGPTGLPISDGLTTAVERPPAQADVPDIVDPAAPVAKAPGEDGVPSSVAPPVPAEEVSAQEMVQDAASAASVDKAVTQEHVQDAAAPPAPVDKALAHEGVQDVVASPAPAAEPPASS